MAAKVPGSRLTSCAPGTPARSTPPWRVSSLSLPLVLLVFRSLRRNRAAVAPRSGWQSTSMPSRPAGIEGIAATDARRARRADLLRHRRWGAEDEDPQSRPASALRFERSGLRRSRNPRHRPGAIAWYCGPEQGNGSTGEFVQDNKPLPADEYSVSLRFCPAPRPVSQGGVAQLVRAVES